MGTAGERVRSARQERGWLDEQRGSVKGSAGDEDAGDYGHRGGSNRRHGKGNREIRRLVNRGQESLGARRASFG